VGKTSLIERFVYNRFDEKYLTTIGVRVSEKLLSPLQDPKSGRLIQYVFLIWDIAGMDRFDDVVKNYYRGAAGALAVADLTRSETIRQLQPILDQFLAVSPDAKLLFLGNKLDIFQEDKKVLKLLKKAASEFSADYLLTSAKTGEHVENAFLTLASQLER
jgi:small GTP-binding protein